MLADRYVSNVTLHSQCSVLPLAYRCKLDLINLMHKRVFRGIDDNYLSEGGRETRLHSAPTLEVTRPLSSKFLNSTAFLGPNAWNSLPVNVRLVGDHAFFKKIVRSLIDDEVALLNQI